VRPVRSVHGGGGGCRLGWRSWITSSIKCVDASSPRRIFRRDAAAVLLIGLDGRSEEDAAQSTRSTSAAWPVPLDPSGRTKADRALLWKSRKSAFCSGGWITPTLLRSGWVFPRSAYRPSGGELKP